MQTRPANEFAHPGWPDLSDEDEDDYGYAKKAPRKQATRSPTKKRQAKKKQPSKAALKQAAIDNVARIENKAAAEEEQAAAERKGIRAARMGRRNGRKKATKDEEADTEPPEEDKDMDFPPSTSPITCLMLTFATLIHLQPTNPLPPLTMLSQRQSSMAPNHPPTPQRLAVRRRERLCCVRLVRLLDLCRSFMHCPQVA